jgi:pimeloyl-ACP methyl ester carboxylesterase
LVASLRSWLESFHTPAYGRRQPLILVNGLAEQAESWFRNHWFWRRHFDVHVPNLLVYDGEALHRRLAADLPIDVNYLVSLLHEYLEAFVQVPPYHLVAASLGGKVAVEYAARYPGQVARLVLLCPSGLGGTERLPLVEGVRRSDLNALVESVFHDPRQVDPRLLAYYRRQFASRRWRLGLLHTVRGTLAHSIRDRLANLRQPTLLITGRDDRIVDPGHAEEVAGHCPHVTYHCVPECGHAPQMEKPWLVNRLVIDFLTGTPAARNAG